ncbi:hypothetical protein H4J02_09390 [Protaetiibacter sp. SSC-01]|uniref:hypothetical protein n=1 Tax=Protaetiibacter sp. SSC-01 TaxID=2759943 RepID=UPI0016575AA2|nr:hypothetical protein [Protaetiibacter sp. SSC-01]QNO36703.1 hypothetical protein H4J02_09390 [Protaetiibacter sp. SSC-01]
MATWKSDVIAALRSLGGEANLSDIYAAVAARRRTLPESWQAIVRQVIESHSSDSNNFKGKDVFYSAGGIGSGRWGLRRP